MLKHVCAWCPYKRGRFERTHGDVLSGHTVFFFFQRVTHDTPQHNTKQQHDHHTEIERNRDRNRDRERRQGQREKGRRKRRDKTREEKTKEDKTRQEKREDSFSVWWCMAVFLVGGVNRLVNFVDDRDLTGFIVQSAHFQKLPLPVLFFRRSFLSGNFYRFYCSERQFRICKKLSVTGFIPQNLIGNHFGQHGNYSVFPGCSVPPLTLRIDSI